MASLHSLNPDKYESVTCSDINVVFDALWTEAEDEVEPVTLFELFAQAVGA